MRRDASMRILAWGAHGFSLQDQLLHWVGVSQDHVPLPGVLSIQVHHFGYAVEPRF